MSTFTSGVSGAPGFTRERYEALLEKAQAAKIDALVVDSLLLDAVDKGANFDAAAEQIGMDIPRLSRPDGRAAALLREWPALPSPGAVVMAVTVDCAVKQIELHRRDSWKKTEALVQSQREQAKEIKTATEKQYALNMAAGALQIASGAVQIGFGAKNVHSLAHAPAGQDPSITGGKAQSWSSVSQGIGGMLQGTSSMLAAEGQRIAGMNQARVKELDAEQARDSAARASIDKSRDALRELILAALRAMDANHTDANQTKKKLAL
ncbi:MAG: hypothetical protein LBD42_05665 [Desulfovibrio sp.]|jgi:hypothetical protein|nr:hypothetical protein [Desulfovibrio sp.]